MGNSNQVPKPVTAEVHRLRRDNWVQHVNIHMRDGALSAQKVELDTALSMVEQGERRESAGREWTEQHVQKLGEINCAVMAALRAGNRKLRAEVRHERFEPPAFRPAIGQSEG